MYNTDMLKKIIIIFTILLVSIVTYFYFQQESYYINDNVETEERKENYEKAKEEILEFEKEPAHKQAEFFEGVVNIDNQPMYYAYPLKIVKNNPPKLIVYSHGQLQRIVKDLDDNYMLKMREYGNFFASRGYAFSASNQHDDNWGQSESLNDIKKSIIWFEENNYPLTEKKSMVGFSMGGKTAVNYAIDNPNEIAKIALLAPTPKTELTKFDVEKLRDIPIKIWHGTEDVNIPFSTTEQYVQRFKNYDKKVNVKPVENAGHFDIETTLMEYLLEFFEE